VFDQLHLHGVADEAIAVGKIAAHWLTFGPLLFIAAFPAAALLDIGGQPLVRLLLSILIGTPALAALAVAVAALTAGLPRAGSMAGLLLLPVAVPLLIFAAAFCADGGRQAMALEAAISMLLLAGAPFVAGAAIRAART
jgi:heme exporter protein B